MQTGGWGRGSGKCSLVLGAGEFLGNQGTVPPQGIVGILEEGGDSSSSHPGVPILPDSQLSTLRLQ